MPKGRTSKFFFILDSENLIIPLLSFLKFKVLFQPLLGGRQTQKIEFVYHLFLKDRSIYMDPLISAKLCSGHGFSLLVAKFLRGLQLMLFPQEALFCSERAMPPATLACAPINSRRLKMMRRWIG